MDQGHRQGAPGRKALRAVNVWINCWDGGNITTPFGGYKQSGVSRDRSMYALEKYIQLKTTWIRIR